MQLLEAKPNFPIHHIEERAKAAAYLLLRCTLLELCEDFEQRLRTRDDSFSTRFTDVTSKLVWELLLL